MKTKTIEKEKVFDAVKFMREQRDKISKEIQHLSTDEIMKYFEFKEGDERVKPSK